MFRKAAVVESRNMTCPSQVLLNQHVVHGREARFVKDVGVSSIVPPFDVQDGAYLPIASFQEVLSAPTLALKSPRMTNLSVGFWLTTCCS